MAPIWGLAILEPSCLSLLLLSGFLVWGFWVLLSGKQSLLQVAFKTNSETSKQHKLKAIQKFTAPQWEENLRMNFMESSLTCFSGFPMGWAQEYILWSMDRSLQQIFQHLENARSSLMELYLPESQNVIASSTSSMIVTKEPVLPSCDCKKPKHIDQNIAGTSSNNSSLSPVSVFSDINWHFRSYSLPILSTRRSVVFRDQSVSLPSPQLSELGKPTVFQNLAAFSSLRSPDSFSDSVLEYSDISGQQKKTKTERRSKSHPTSDQELEAIFKMTPQFSEYAPIQLPPMTKWELEGHMAWKVCTLRKQTVPLVVRESWAMLNYLTEVQTEDLEPEKTPVPFSMPIHQSTGLCNSNSKSPDLSSFQLDVNTGAESGVSRTKSKLSQSLSPGNLPQPGDGPQILGLKPLVTSMGASSPQGLGVDIIQEETTFLHKDPTHVLELSIEQRVIGLPEKNIQQHKSQVTNMELTSRIPFQDTDSIKVTPLALLQVMDSMGMIPESHSEVIESVGLFSQLPDKAGKPIQDMKAMSTSHKPSSEVAESVGAIPMSQCQIIESEMLTSRSLKQGTDNMKVTPVALLQVMDSMGMTTQSHPCIIGSVKMTPKPLYPDIESMKIDTLSGQQVLQPGQMNSQHIIIKPIEMSPESQHKFSQSVDMSKSQRKVTELEASPVSIYQNTESPDTTFRSSHQVRDYMKVTPVAILQTMDSVGRISPAQPHSRRSAGLTPDSQSQVASLNPGLIQSGVLTSNHPPTIDSLGFAISVDIPPKATSTVEKSDGMISAPSHHPIHSLKVMPIAQESPVGVTTTLQSQEVGTKDLTLRLVSQDTESLGLTPGPWTQVSDSVGTTLPSHHQGTESIALTPGSSPQAMESLRLIAEHQVLEHLQKSQRQSHQVMETMGLTSDMYPQRKKSADLTQLHHQIIESSGTVPTPLSQDTESVQMRAKLEQKVTESAAKTTTLPLQNMKSVTEHSVTDAMKLTPALQNVKSGKLTLGQELQSKKPVDVAANSTPQPVKSGHPIPPVNPKALAPEFQPPSVKSELPQASQWQTEKSAEVIPSSQFQDVQYAHWTWGLPGQTVVETLRSPKEDRSVELAPESRLQNLSSKESASVVSCKEGRTPQTAAYRRQDLKPEGLLPGAHIQKVQPINYQTIVPEGLTPYQTSEPLGMILEPVNQETQSKFTFDTCHEAEESVRLTQASLGYTSGSASPTSEFLQMKPRPSQGASETVLPSVDVMADIPVSQHPTQGALRLVQGLENQGMKSEMFIPQFQCIKLAHPDAGPHSGVVNCEALMREPQFETTKSMPLTSEPKPQSIKPERLTLGSLISDKKGVDLSIPWGESRGMIPDAQLLHAESRSWTMEPHLQTTVRAPDQETASAELASAFWPQKEESVKLTSQQVTEIAGEMSTPYFQKMSGSTLGLDYNTETVRPMCETLAQEIAGQAMKSAGMTLRPHLQVMETSETSLRPEFENAEMAGGTLFPCKNIQGTWPEPSYSQKELGSEMKYKASKSLLEILQSVKLTSKLVPIGVGSKQCATGLMPHVREVTSGSQSQGTKTRQLGRESQLQDMKCAELNQQSVSGVAESEKLIHQSGLQSTRSEGLTNPPQIQDMESIPGPLLQSVRFSKSSPPLSFLQGEKLVGFTSQGGVRFKEVTPGSPIPEIKLSDFIPWQKHQDTQLTPEPQPQGGKFVELNSGPYLQDVVFSDLTPESKHQDSRCVQSIPETQQKDIKSLRFAAESSLQISQLSSIGDVKSVLSPIDLQLSNKEPKRLMSELHFSNVKSEEINVGPRQEEVKISELTSGPKLQGVKFGEQDAGSMLYDMKTVTPELGLQDSSLVKNYSGLQDKKPSGHNFGPWLQDVKFSDLTLETQPQSVKPSESSTGPQLQCVKFSELTPESKTHGVRSMELYAGELTRRPESPNIKSSKLDQQQQLEDTKPVDWIPTTKLRFKSELRTSESQVVDKNSATPTIRHYLKDIKSMFHLRNSNLEGEKSMKATSGPQLQDLKFVEIVPDHKHQDANANGFTLYSRPNEFKDKELAAGTQLEPQLDIPGKGTVPSALGSLFLTLQGVQSEELASESQKQDRKFVAKTSCLKNQSLKSADGTPESEKKYVKSAKLIPKLKRQVQLESASRRQKLQGIQSIDFALGQQFPGMEPIHLTPGSQKGLQLSGITLAQHCGSSEELRRDSKSEKSMYLGLIPKLMINSPKEAKRPQLLQVKPLELTSEAQPENRVTLRSKQKPHLKSSNCVQGMKSVGLGLESQSLGVPSAEPISVVKLRDTESSGLTLVPTIQGETCMELNLQSQLQRSKTPEPNPGSQLQKGRPFVSTSAPPLQGVKTVALSKDLQFGSMKWIPGPAFQDMDSLLDFGSQSQCITPVDWKHLLQLRDVTSSVLNTSSKFLYHQHQVDLNPCLQFEDMKPSDLTSMSESCDIKSVIFKPTLESQDEKSPELIPRPHPQEVKPIQSCLGTQLQGVTSPMATEESRFPQLKAAILSQRSQLPTSKSTGLNSLFYLKSTKSQELTPQEKFQGVKSQEFNSVSQKQGLKSSQKPLEAEFQDRTFTEFNSAQLQGLPFSRVTTGTKIQGVTSHDFNHGSLLQDRKCSEITLQAMLQDTKHKEYCSGPPQQVMKSELILGSVLQSTALEFNPEPQVQGLTSSNTIPDTKMEDSQSIKSKPESPWEGMESSKLKLETEFLKVNLMECKPAPQLQDVESSELITGIQFDNVKSKCKSKGTKSFEDLLREKFQDVKTIEVKFSPMSQDKKSDLPARKKFPGMKSVESHSDSQLENIECSELIMGIKLKDTKPTGFRSRPHSQRMKPSEVIPQPKFQEMKLQLHSGPQIQSKKSSESMKLQIKNYTAVEHGPEFQVNPNLSDLTLESMLHHAIPSEFTARKHWQDEEPLAVNPQSDFRNRNFMLFNPGPQLQHTNTPELCKDTKLQDMKILKITFNQQLKNKKSELCLGTRLQDKKSYKLNPDTEIQSKSSMIYSPHHLQNVNSSDLALGTKDQHTRFGFNLGTKMQSEISKMCSLGSHRQDLKSRSISESQFLCGAARSYSLGPQMQYASSSVLNPESKSQCTDSVECTGTKCKCVRSDLSLGPELHGTRSALFNLAQYLHNIKREMTPGTKYQSTASIKIKPGRQLQSVNSSKLNSWSEHQCINSTKCNLGPHMQSTKAFDLNPESKSQGQSILFNSGSHLHNVKPSELSPGTKLPEGQCLENHPRSRQQVAQSVFTLNPHISGVKSGVFAPEIPLAEDKSGIVNKETLACGTNSGKLTPGCEGQSMKSEVSAGEACFQKAKPMELNPASSPQSISCRRLPSHRRQHRERSVESDPELTILGVKYLDLKVGHKPQDVNSKKLSSSVRHKSMMLESNPCSQDLKSIKSDFCSQPQSSSEFPSCLSTHCVNSVPESCCQAMRSAELMAWSQQRSTNCQDLISGWDGMKSVFSPSQPTKKLMPGPMVTIDEISNLPLESQHQQFQGVKSLEVTQEPKLQNKIHTGPPSVSIQQASKSVKSAPESSLQIMKSENSTQRRGCQMTNSLKSGSGPEHQVIDYKEMILKSRHQAIKSMNLVIPVYQVTEASGMAQRPVCQNTKSVEKPVELTPQSRHKVMESLGIPLEQDLKVVQFANLTPIPGNQGLSPLEKSNQIQGVLNFSQKTWPKIKDLGELCKRSLQQAMESERMTPDLHVTETMDLASEAMPHVEEFLGMTLKTKSVSKVTRHLKRPSRPYPQLTEPMEMTSEKRAQREGSVALITKPLHHVPELSEVTLGLGHHIPESVGLTSETERQMKELMKLKPKPQDHVESSGLGYQVLECMGLIPEQCTQRDISPKQTDQLEHIESLQTLQTWSVRPTQLQKQSKKYSDIVTGPVDQTKKCEKASPKSLDKSIRPTKAQIQATQQVGVVPSPPEKVIECGTVISGPSLQVVKTVPLVPESASQIAEYIGSASKLQEVRPSEFMSGIRMQNVKSKKLITAYQILETTELAGCQIIKTVLNPGLPLQVVKSEELVPRPTPQVVEPIQVALGKEAKAFNCLDLLPTPYIKKLVQSPRSDTKVKYTEFTAQPSAPLSVPTVSTYEELQIANSTEKNSGPLQVMEPVGLNLGRVCQNGESEESILGKLQVKNSFSRPLYNSSNSFVSFSTKTPTELEGLWDSEVAELSRTLNIKSLRKNIFHSEESSINPMIQSSMYPLTFLDQLSDKTAYPVETTHSEILMEDILSKRVTKRKQYDDSEDPFQSPSQHPPQRWRLPSKTCQAGLGTQRRLSSSFLGRQQNVWENHSQRQRLPRKYLSNMIMLGNVLGTTMKRTLCSPISLMESSIIDACQSIQNLFGVPAELMEFSQSPLEKARDAISHPSAAKNYIQRRTSCHSDEKGLVLKMWTRSSLSSIIHQYSRSQARIKERNSKPTDMTEEIIQHIPISYTECQPPVPAKSRSSLNLLFARRDSILVEESVNLHGDSQARIFGSQHSLKQSYLSQDKSDFSEQFQMLQDLQLKIAAKLLRCQIPHDVPPPLASGLVLKYPICLQCGRCSGFNCCHKLQTTFGPYLLIYPQLHLVSTPEGHGEIRLHLGFRLRTGKRPQVPRYHRRDTSSTARRSKSPSLRKAKIYTRASKISTSIIDLQSRCSESPPSIHISTNKRQWGSPGFVRKTKKGELGHYESTQVHSLPETDSEINQDKKWAKRKPPKTSYSRHSKRRITKVSKTPSTKSYTNSKTAVQSCSRESATQVRKKKSGTSQTTTPSLKRQPKSSPQPRFVQLLFKGIKQAFQTAHKFVALAGQKPEDRTRADHLQPGKNYHPKQKNVDYSIKTSTTEKKSAVKLRSADSVTKQDSLLGETKQLRVAQLPKSDSSFRPRLTYRPKTPVSQKSTIPQTNSIRRHQGMTQNDSSNKTKKNFRNETLSLKSKNSKAGARIQVQERVLHGSSMKITSHFKEKYPHKEQNHPGIYRGRAPCSSSERSPYNLSEGSHITVSGRSHQRPSQRSHRSPSERKFRSPSERRCRSPSERRCRSSSERRGRSPTEKTHPALSKTIHPGSYEKRQHKLSEKNHRYPSEKGRHSHSERSQPSDSEKSGSSRSGRSGRSQLGKSQHCHSRRNGRSHFGKSQHSHSERSGHSQSGKSQNSHSERSGYSHSEKSQHSRSERSGHSHSEKSQHSHSERSGHSHSEKSQHSHSERSGHSHSEKSQRSHSERSGQSLSGRSGLSQSEKNAASTPVRILHRPPQERVRKSGPKERPRHTLSRDVKNHPRFSFLAHSPKNQSRPNPEA